MVQRTTCGTVLRLGNRRTQNCRRCSAQEWNCEPMPSGSQTKSGAAALLLLKLLVDHLGVVGKRSLIFRILSEVGVFFHVNLADDIL